jgi:hypothetical protein
MRLKIALIAAAAAVLLATVPAFAGGLTLRLDTRERQLARDLNVKVTCIDDPCTVDVTGKARVGTKKFQIRPKERSLAADETERFKLRVKRLRRLEELLAERDGKAVVKARGTRADGASTKLKIEIALKG